MSPAASDNFKFDVVYLVNGKIEMSHHPIKFFISDFPPRAMQETKTFTSFHRTVQCFHQNMLNTQFILVIGILSLVTWVGLNDDFKP